MEKEFVTYEAAKKLKALGFDEPCISVYGYNMQGYPKEMSERLVGIIEISFTEGWPIEPKDLKNSVLGEDISAPTYSSVFRWFREEYSLDHEISYAGKKGEYQAFVKEYAYGNNGNNPSVFSYEEAEVVCLEKLLEIAEENGPKIIF